MPMNTIWVARNQGGDVNDSDLASLRDVAWNEFVKKRFLPSVAEGTPVADAAVSMLEIVRSMNLQRKRFQIMGLHEQVEASELQLVLHLCQAGLLHTSEYRITANRFRRHDKLFEAFALAVGAFVCASAPFTLGVATTQLNRSLQYDYKKHTIALFVYVLQQNRALITQTTGIDEDYVARIARLIIVSQDAGIAGHREDECDKRKDSDEFLRSLSDSVQRLADRVDRVVEKTDRELSSMRDERRDGPGRGKTPDYLKIFQDMRDSNARAVESMRRENREMRVEFESYKNSIDSRVDQMKRENSESMKHNYLAFQEYITTLRGLFDELSKKSSENMNSYTLEMRELKSELNQSIHQKQLDLERRFNELKSRLESGVRSHSFQQGPQDLTTVSQQNSDPAGSERGGGEDAALELRLRKLIDEMIQKTYFPRLTESINQQVDSSIESKIIPGLNEMYTSMGKIPSLENASSMVNSAYHTLSAQQSRMAEVLSNQIQQMQNFVSREELTSSHNRMASIETQIEDIRSKLDEKASLGDIQDVLEIVGTIRDQRQGGGRPVEFVLKREGEAARPENIREIALQVFNDNIRKDDTVRGIADAVSRSREVESKIDSRIGPIDARLSLVEGLKLSTGNERVFDMFGQQGSSGAQYQQRAAAAEEAVGDVSGRQ